VELKPAVLDPAGYARLARLRGSLWTIERFCDTQFFIPSRTLMKKFVLIFFLATAPCSFASQATASQAARDLETDRWKQEARNVSITRDDWGIAHVYGKTDADAVFGMIYAQAEDDFNRVETNYIDAIGHLAEVEGESKIYRTCERSFSSTPRR
jgi:hypothetical protein